MYTGIQPIHLHQLFGAVNLILRGVQVVFVIIQLFREDVHIVRALQRFHQVQQLPRTAGQCFLIFQILCAAAQSPPVVHRAGGGYAVPAAVKNRAHDLHIKGIPPPYRQAQRLQTAVRQLTAQAVIPVGVGGFPAVPGVDHIDLRAVGKIQRVGGIGLAGPAQPDAACRTHALKPLRKGVYRSRHTVHRVCRHIADVPGLGHDAGQHTQQIGHLVGAGVVGAHQRVRRVQRAVQDTGLGVLRRHLQAGVVHPHAGGEHHVRIVVGHLLQHLLCVHLRVHILVAADIYLVRENLGQCSTPFVMGTHPCADLGVVFVDKRHPQLAWLLAGAEDIQLGQQRLRRAFGRVQRKLHAVGLGKHLHLVPQLFQILPHLRRGGVVCAGVAVHRKVHQQCIAGGQPHSRAAQRIELLVEHGVEGRKVQPVVLCPRLAAGLTHQRLQLAVTAQLGKMHIVHLGQLVEVQKLVVDLIFQLVRAGRDEPRDRAGDLDRTVILEHRHPLVALLHIEPVHVLIGNDGGLDALLQMRIAQA